MQHTSRQIIKTRLNPSKEEILVLAEQISRKFGSDFKARFRVNDSTYDSVEEFKEHYVDIDITRLEASFAKSADLCLFIYLSGLDETTVCSTATNMALAYDNVLVLKKIIDDTLIKHNSNDQSRVNVTITSSDSERKYKESEIPKSFIEWLHLNRYTIIWSLITALISGTVGYLLGN
jgi:hypothetical protein